MEGVYCISPYVLIRREEFGGMAFHRKRGLTIELDGEAFRLLNLFQKPRSSSELVRSPEEERLVRDFLCLGLIRPSSLPPVPLEEETPKYLPSEYGGWLSAPEVVHIGLTSRCDLSCPYCYREEVDQELSFEELSELMRQLSEAKVFQVALGGGEPFLREDIFELLELCRDLNITANITTNGTFVTHEVIRRLKDVHIGQINVSVHELNGPTKALKMLVRSGLRVGVNILVTSDILPSLDDIFTTLKNLGIGRVTVLRPKPGADKVWFHRNRLMRGHLFKLKEVLGRWEGKLDISVDTSLACLMGELGPRDMQEHGIYGCTAGRRFCAIEPSGKVYPCSFLKGPSFLAGDIRRSPFLEIWRGSDVFRTMRKLPQFLKGRCGSCDVKDFCLGARCIVWSETGDIYGEDRECPKGER